MAVGVVAAADSQVEAPQVDGRMTGQIPSWARAYLSEEDNQKISQAVKDAEAKTSAEIITMLVRRSSGSHMVPFTMTLLWTILLLLLAINRQELLIHDHYWWILPLLIVLGATIAFVVAQGSFIQKLFTHPRDRHMQVWTRAELEFHRQQFDRTPDHKAVLIFASLFERDVVVLADSKIAEKLPSETWMGIVDTLVSGFREKSHGHGWVQAIEKCGTILAEKFPAESAHKPAFSAGIYLKE